MTDLGHDRIFRLYVPAPDAVTSIRPRSAIVGDPGECGIDVHYEGGSQAANVQSFDERVLQAAGRRAQNYPTIACALLPAKALVDVGEVRYDTLLRRWIVSDVTDATALEAWVGEPVAMGGSEAFRNEALGSLFSRFTSQGMVDYSIAIRTGLTPAEAIQTVARTPGRVRD